VFYPAEGEKPPRTKDELRAAMERRGLKSTESNEPVAIKAADTAARAIGGRAGVKSE